MTPRKKIILALITLTLMLMALRETSLIDLNFYQSYTNTSFNSTINTSSSFVSWGDTKTKPAPEVKPEDLSIVILLGKDTVYKELNKLLPIVVKIQDFQTGPLWIPLYKSARFSALGIPSFDPRQKLKGEFRTSAYKIGISGRLAVTGHIVIKGLCSHKQAVKLVKEQIIEKFSASIKEEFTKRSPEYFQAMSTTHPL